MTAHVLDQVADYMSGRLAADGRVAFEAHLADCDQCAREVAFAREFRDAGMTQDAHHLAAERLVELAADPSAAAPEEQAHLAACSDCSDEMDWAAALPTEPATAPEQGPSSSLRDHRPRLRFAWVGLAAAAALLLFVYVPRGPGGDLPGLARLEPLPVRTSRGGGEPGSFEELRLLGMESYAAGDYGAAHERLLEASRLRGENLEVQLFLASAALMQGRRDEARGVLEEIAAAADEPILRHEAIWLLAQAALLDRDGAGARRWLDEIVESGGRHREEARALLRALP